MEQYTHHDSPEERALHHSTFRAPLQALLTEGANAWGISRGTLIAIWSLPVLVIAGAVVSALMGKEMYKWYTGEDGFAETLQVLFYMTALVMNLMLMKQLLKKEYRVIMALYGIVLLGLVFMIGEELSWGQRLFGWETADSFKSVNRQNETNLHNIYGVGEIFKWLQMMIGAYGTFPPLLLLRPGFFKRNEKFFSFVIPHFTLIPFFLPLFLWRLYRNLFDPPEKFSFAISEFNEVMELILAMGMALFLLYQLRRFLANRR